jgi:hypothetical protein
MPNPKASCRTAKAKQLIPVLMYHYPCLMKTIYTRFRIALMAFALGLAAVYMGDRLGSEVRVELPTAESASVFSVFTDTPPTLRRERNCGKDPLDAQARIDCANERLFGNRDMSRYAQYEITCDWSTPSESGSLCDLQERRKEREAVWRHWREKTRAHIMITYLHQDRRSESHYFIEPYENENWHLVAQYKSFKIFLVDGLETEVGIVDDDDYPLSGAWAYKHARWRISAHDGGPYDPAGTRYLEFENETGDIVEF